MPKINIPLGENDQLDYSGEMVKMNELIANYGRTTVGACSFTSPSSGVTYNTDDYPDNEAIYNNGELGMIYLFRELFGGNGGFLLTAEDVNHKVVNAVISTDGWSGPEYSLAVEGVTETSVQEILPAIGITEEQLAALQKANLQDSGQVNGMIYLFAYGETPEIDIPIRVILRGE